MSKDDRTTQDESGNIGLIFEYDNGYAGIKIPKSKLEDYLKSEIKTRNVRWVVDTNSGFQTDLVAYVDYRPEHHHFLLYEANDLVNWGDWPINSELVDIVCEEKGEDKAKELCLEKVKKMVSQGYSIPFGKILPADSLYLKKLGENSFEEVGG